MSRLLQMGLVVAVVHGLEDVALLSMGRFLPVPIWAMYSIGIGVSVTILTLLINSFTDRFKP
tara:strand:- start:1024 stop:1209 length:186 start_codon:yes stop_codon:yes gene_type:complete